MAQAQQKVTQGSIGTVDKVKTGADLPVAPPLVAITTPVVERVERKAHGARRLHQAEEDRYQIVARRMTPQMVDVISGLPRQHGVAIMRGTDEAIKALAPSVVRYLKNRGIVGRVIEVVTGSQNRDGSGQAILKVRRPAERTSKRTVPELSEWERAELKAIRDGK